ncbi:MAG: rhomboid family intramembrane serine protease [Maritimibacter sp.]
MFPIRDHNPSERTPYVTYTLIAVNILAFLFFYLPYLSNNAALNEVYMTGGLVPARITSGQGYFTFITSMFLHGGFMHLAGNMLFLWIFGDNLEDELGHVGFSVFYVASGVGAALLQIIAAPNSAVPMVGASGAIAGVMGGYLLLFPKARVDVLFIIVIIFKVFPLPAWLMLGAWFALQVFNGAASPSGEGGVAHWAHAGGFIVGFLWVLPKWFALGGPRFWARTHGHPPHPDAQYRFQSSSIPTVKRRR